MICTNLYYTERVLTIECVDGDYSSVTHGYSTGEYRYVRATEAAKILQWFAHDENDEFDGTFFYYAPCENWKMPVVQLRAKYGTPNTEVGKAVREAIDALKLQLSRHLECDEHSHSAEATNKMLQLT